MTSASSQLTTDATPSSRAEGPRPVVVERILNVNITGTLSDFSMAGDAAALWRPAEGLAGKIFGLGTEADAHASANSLRAASVQEMLVECERSTFPVSMGIRVNCIPPKDVTDIGERFTYTVMPLSAHHVPHTIYKCDTDAHESLQWRENYSRWNNANLESEGALHVDNVPYVFVNDQHPVIGLLRHNTALIGCDIDTQPKIDNEWFKVSRQVLSVCCNTLRQKVLSKLTTHDLNTLQVQAFRLNAHEWGDVNQELEANLGAGVDRDGLQAALNTPYTYTARLRMKYELPAVVA